MLKAQHEEESEFEWSLESIKSPTRGKIRVRVVFRRH